MKWINPIGGFGDMLMLSGVLKLVADTHPERRYALARRTGYGAFLDGHPAIDRVGFPPKGAPTQRVDYWSMETLGPGPQRPFQVLARGFGLATPVDEVLWIPGAPAAIPALERLLPSGRRLVAISPSSASPRKTAPPAFWRELVKRLVADDLTVVQLGQLRDAAVPGAWSLRGLTTPREAMTLLARCALLIGCDNFLSHAACYAGIPAVVLWGPTDHRVYGWPGHVHLQLPKGCGLPSSEDCIGPKWNEGGKRYASSCPEGRRHCLDQADPDEVYTAARRRLAY